MTGRQPAVDARLASASLDPQSGTDTQGDPREPPTALSGPLTDPAPRAPRRVRESPELAGFLRRMARALVRRAERHDLDALGALRQARDDIDLAIGDAARALAAEYTWDQIGAELGISKQAAHKRFAEVTE